MKKLSEEQAFVHDISTPMTTIKFHLKKEISGLEDQTTELDREKILQALRKVFLALEKLEALHAARKEKISKSEAA